ncbi:hypothetical protein EDC96DRAFT_541405 [Choanephora cucurbitarum]|nr:hypothetical protein EDC96DRAFT_541405 [Choanephora cucurbitarum]
MPLKNLAKLCSFVFLREVNSSLEECAVVTEKAVEELTEALFSFDVVTDNKTPFSTRYRAHYLHHLHEDIPRFGCALQHEIKKGEMHNKSIREQLFHQQVPSFKKCCSLI